MRPLSHAMLLSSLALLFTGVSLGASTGQKESQPASAAEPAATAAAAVTRESFTGIWAYNSQDSMNAVNGRNENAPGATHRPNSVPGARSGGNGTGPGSLGPGTGGNGITGFGQPSQNPSPFASLVVNEKRDLVRDLLEVPVELRIRLTDAAITFVDHLDRELTYPTSGKKQKYQLSASIFEAKTYWDGPQLKKDIEATEGFRMSEVYFLSGNGKRLFVIVRVGDPKSKDPETPLVGVNRVYDRVER
jgi:hypothetical protein